jgi:hypothetical protein
MHTLDFCLNQLFLEEWGSLKLKSIIFRRMGVTKAEHFFFGGGIFYFFHVNKHKDYSIISRCFCKKNGGQLPPMLITWFCP